MKTLFLNFLLLLTLSTSKFILRTSKIIIFELKKKKNYRQVHGVGDGKDYKVGRLVGRPLEDVVENTLLPEKGTK
jgi:hypothetical protein